MHSIGASIYLEMELENALEETSIIQLELEKPGFLVVLGHIWKWNWFRLLWSLLYLSYFVYYNCFVSFTLVRSSVIFIRSIQYTIDFYAYSSIVWDILHALIALIS